jgi:hypothetical protein
MDKLIELGFRNNIETFMARGKRIIIYNDHRTILNVLFFALKEKVITEIPNVFYFDYHDDGLDPKKEITEKSIDFNLEDMSFEEFYSIVEFKMSINDDDWVKTGMEFNLIKNSVSIGAEEAHNIANHEVYKDTNDREHNIFKISHLRFELGSQGCLGDSQIRKFPYYKKLREIFNYNTTGRDNFHEKLDPFILDFDLDYFSTLIMDRKMAWPHKLFKEEFLKGSDNLISAMDFTNHLIDKCEFITIAMEPTYCGGFGECNNILRLVDHYFFEEQLKTITYAH